MFRRAAWLLLHFASCVVTRQNATFLGVALLAMTPKFELGRYFCTMHLLLKFHHLMFTRSEVIVLTHTHKHTHKPTNKHIPAKTSSVLRYAIRRWVIIQELKYLPTLQF